MPASATAPILHADLDAFYASVEQRDDPALRGRPVIVGAGVVLASSYEARACGVRTAMNGARARALCPEAVVVRPRFDAYTRASKAVFEVFRRAAPVVEALSIDEAFLDVSGMGRISGTPLQIAIALRREVAELVGLPITIGAASTKFLAKVASGVAKPHGVLVVPAGAEAAFLAPLPVRRLWGVGAVTGARLNAEGLQTVGDVAAIDEQRLVSLLGRGHGRHVHALAHNRDPRAVRAGVRRRSIGAQRALGRARRADPAHPGRSLAELDESLMALVDRVTRRMRAAGRACRTVVLRLRFDDFARVTRSHTVIEATARTTAVLAIARRLLRASAELIARRGLTLIGISLTNLCDAAAIQLALPLDRTAGLDRAVDAVRDRFGTAAVSRGRLLGRADDEWIPLPPGG